MMVVVVFDVVDVDDGVCAERAAVKQYFRSLDSVSAISAVAAAVAVAFVAAAVVVEEKYVAFVAAAVVWIVAS